MDRIRTVSDLYYKPERDELALAAAFDEYRKPLRNLPRWAVAAAFDQWVKTATYRPSPAHIKMLAEKALQPITDELARRERARREQESAPKPRDPQMAEEAERITQNAGFTTKRALAVKARPMARNEDELYDAPDPKANRHWTETVPPNSPQMQQLKRARLENPLMRDGMIKAGHMDPETDEERAYRLYLQEQGYDPE